MVRVHRSPGTGSQRAGNPTDPEALRQVVLLKSPLLVYIADLDFKVVLMSQALRDLTGYDTSDCPSVDALIARFYPDPGMQKLVHGVHQGFVRNEHIRGDEFPVTAKDGSQRRVAWSTSRLRSGGNGSTVGYVVYGVDVTTRFALQQWFAIFQQTLSRLDEGVALTDPAGNLLGWSEGAQRLLGHRYEQLQGQPLSDLFGADERELVSRSVDEAVFGEGAFHSELELRHADGHQRALVFHQVRLDGEGGAPMARMTMLSEPTIDLSEALEETRGELQTLRLKLEESERELQGRDEELQSLRMEALPPEAVGAADDQALTEAIERAAAAEGRVAALEALLAERPAEPDATSLTDRIAELEAALTASEDADARVAELQQAHTLATEALQVANQALQAAQAAAAESGEQLTRTEVERDEVKAALDAAVAERDEAKAAAEAATAALESARTEAGAAIAERDEARAALNGARADWVSERDQMAQDHREEIEELRRTTDEDRLNLEAQLHKDILSAEERADTELSRLHEAHAQERKEWEDAAAIARAETEAELRGELEAARRQSETSGDLQPHLAEVADLCLVAADPSGRVIGWSGGAALLDGRSAAEALGKHLHKDVLALEGIDWKDLFGRVVVAGSLERDAELCTANGETRTVRLHARLLKGSGGKLLGVTELIKLPELTGSVDLHAQAAFGRLSLAWRRGASALVGGGSASAQAAGQILGDLGRVGAAVQRGGGWAGVIEQARLIDLEGTLEALDGAAEQLLEPWRRLGASLADLGRIEAWLDGDVPVPWNDAVHRLLHAAEDAVDLERPVERRFGDAPTIEGRGSALVPLLAVLLQRAVLDGSPVETGTDGGAALLRLPVATLADEDAGALAGLCAAAQAELRTEVGLELRVPVSAGLAAPAAKLDELELDAEGSADAEDAQVETEADLGDELEAELQPEDEATSGDDGDADDLALDADDLALDADEPGDAAAADDAVASSDEPSVSESRPRKGLATIVESSTADDLVLMAGEDSVAGSGEALGAHLVGDSVDELEQAFRGARPSVSDSILATAGEMEAYAAEKPVKRRPHGASADVAAELEKALAGEEPTDGGPSQSPRKRRRRKKK